jgi:hypothetical protein
MNSSQPENEIKDNSEMESNENFPILIKRITKKTKQELSISYDTTPLEKILKEKIEEKSELLKLIKNILLSCNISYFIYMTNKIYNYLKSLFFYNLFYFLFLKILFNFLNKNTKEKKENEIEVPIWKRLILFNLPELLIIFYYHKKKYSKINQSITSLFSYLNERISYIFNTQENHNYLCKINQKNYDIYLYKKDHNEIKDLYTNNKEYLSKDTFFNSVIAYSNAEFGDFDFNNLEKNEEEMYQEIFILINNIEKKIKDDHSTLKTLASFGNNISFTNSTKFNVLYALGFKLASFLVNEIYLNNYACKLQRKNLIEEKTKEFNQKHIEEGYFLALNEHVILLFKIKDNYKSFDESYSLLYNDSQNLLKHYFN